MVARPTHRRLPPTAELIVDALDRKLLIHREMMSIARNVTGNRAEENGLRLRPITEAMAIPTKKV
jgi:hypothetical protein